MRPPLIGVVGGSTCTAQEAESARAVGRLLAEAGALLLCGGLGGVMEAAARGARLAGGLTIGLLPGSDAAAANSSIVVAIPTGLGELRNGLLVRAAGAVIAIGGGWGTLSEIALARRIETPVVGLHDAFAALADLPRVAGPEEAVRWALEHAAQPKV